jgi:hypothetical protein
VDEDAEEDRGAFPSVEEMEAVEEEDSEWETDEDEDDDAPWEPRPCESLFDGFESETFKDNLEYMRTQQGFVIPYRGNLTDPEGLVSHLQRKIYRKRACVWCERKFTTLEGVRGHMRDKQHVKIKYEPPVVYRMRNATAFDPKAVFAADDGYVPELNEFYDFSETDAAAAVVEAATFDTQVGGLYKLTRVNA